MSNVTSIADKRNKEDEKKDIIERSIRLLSQIKEEQKKLREQEQMLLMVLDSTKD